MPLDEKTRDRIFNEAKAYARKHDRKEIGYYMLNYEAGATAEAERAVGLVNALVTATEMVKDLLNPKHNPPQVADKIVDIEIFVNETLTKYNNSK